MWRSHALTPLTALRGSIEFLRRGLVGELSQEQRQLLDSAVRQTQDTIACWQHLTNYLILHYPVETDSWEAVVLATEIDQLVRRVQQETPIQKVEVSLPEVLPAIRGNAWLQQALLNLLYPIDQSPQVSDVVPSIRVWATDEETLRVQIVTGKLINLDVIGELAPAGLYPGSCLHTAAVILQRHRSGISLTTTSENTIFELALPIWEEPVLFQAAGYR